MDDETARWLVTLDPRICARLAAVGLTTPRSRRKITLQYLLDEFFNHLDVKPITRLGYESTRKSQLEHFGSSTSIRDIEPLYADRWRASMKSSGLVEATISKRVKLARQIFRKAVRWKMLAENPFADLKAGSQMNKSRQRFISQEDTK